MKKIIANWKLIINCWREKRKEKEFKTEIEVSKECILHLLLNEKTTEVSVEVFEYISEHFKYAMEERVKRIEQEKIIIGEFLNK